MATGQQGKRGTPPGQFPMNSGNPPPKGVTSKTSIPARDKGRDSSSASVGGADSRLGAHNARVRRAGGKK